MKSLESKRSMATKHAECFLALSFSYYDYCIRWDNLSKKITLPYTFKDFIQLGKELQHLKRLRNCIALQAMDWLCNIYIQAERRAIAKVLCLHTVNMRLHLLLIRSAFPLQIPGLSDELSLHNIWVCTGISFKGLRAQSNHHQYSILKIFLSHWKRLTQPACLQCQGSGKRFIMKNEKIEKCYSAKDI